MTIPLNISPLGFTLAPAGELPAGYTRLAFLESTGTQYIITNSYMTDENVLECCYQTAPVTAAALYVFGNTTPPGRTWAWGEYGTSLTAYYAYTWTGLRGSNAYPFSPPRYTKNVTRLGLDFVERDGVQLSLKPDGGTPSPSTGDPRPMGIFGANYTAFRAYAHKIWYFKNFDAENTAVTDMLPVINRAGTPGMFDKVTRTFFANDGSGLFICGFETLDQLTALAANLPTVTDTPEIKLSLPGEWNGDASANAQLSIITGKGWSTTISYRDVETSTSSSFVLGNRGDGGSALVLWCRAVESDSGNYQDADGTRYYVETCHDIWHPQELSPDDLGYTAVLTLEDYLTERGLAAIEYPEEELTA